MRVNDIDAIRTRKKHFALIIHKISAPNILFRVCPIFWGVLIKTIFLLVEMRNPLIRN